MTLNLNFGTQGAEADITVANHLLACLTTCLQGQLNRSTHIEITNVGLALEPLTTDRAELLFPNPLALLNRLQSMMEVAFIVKTNPDAGVLASTCFIVLLKISLRSKAFWIHFKEADMCATFLTHLLLEEPAWQVRRRVADCVRGICADIQK